jgi:hypothetical protein
MMSQYTVPLVRQNLLYPWEPPTLVHTGLKSHTAYSTTNEHVYSKYCEVDISQLRTVLKSYQTLGTDPVQI